VVATNRGRTVSDGEPMVARTNASPADAEEVVARTNASPADAEEERTRRECGALVCTASDIVVFAPLELVEAILVVVRWLVLWRVLVVVGKLRESQVFIDCMTSGGDSTDNKTPHHTAHTQQTATTLNECSQGKGERLSEPLL
jgi:hypothetical protein